jgi:hypothetical protein
MGLATSSVVISVHMFRLKPTVRRLAAPSAFALVLLACDHRSADNGRATRVAEVLLDAFETVVQSNVQLLSPGAEASKQFSIAELGNLRVPFAYLQRALDSLPRPASASALAASDAVFVGAKDFRAPARLGAVRSRRCYVIVLGKGHAFDIRTHVSGASVTVAAGAPIWNWTADLQEFGEGDPKASSIYTSQIGSSYLLLSNDLGALQDVVHALTTADASSAVTGVRDWAIVSGHEEWAYRRYRHTTTLDRNAAGLTNVTPTADVLMFFLNSDRKSGVLRLLASDERTADRLNRSMEAALAWQPLQPSGPSAWETTIRFTGDDASGQRTFVIFGLFGFATFL